MRSGQWIALLVGLIAMTLVVAGGALAAADGAGQANDRANGSNVTVETGQQLSTVMEVTEDDVRTDVDDSTLLANNDSERTAAIASAAPNSASRRSRSLPSTAT